MKAIWSVVSQRGLMSLSPFHIAFPVDDLAAARRFSALGVDAIVTDSPERLATLTAP